MPSNASPAALFPAPLNGERELRFGHTARGVALSWRKAVFGARAEMQTLPCVAVHTDGRVLTGTWRGELYVWENQGCRLWRRFDAHAGPLQNSEEAHAVCKPQASRPNVGWLKAGRPEY